MPQNALSDVDATTLRRWLDEDKAILIDIREPDEFAREHIPGARLVPLSAFDKADFQNEDGKIAVFHCNSGTRSAAAAPQILGTAFNDVRHLQGGLEAWRKAGLPVTVNRKAPISIMRQVQITAGSLVVLGVVLAAFVSPWWMGLSGFVGIGLMFAGLSGTCGLASFLALMPWNRTNPSVPRNAMPAQGQ